MKTIPLLALLIILSGCASKPVLYPNQKLKSVGKEAPKQDIRYCEEEADEFIESPRGKQILTGAGKGAAVGGAMGAVTGLLSGDIVGGALFGGLLGGTAGGVGEAISPDELERRYVTRCLQEKGYEVIGWD